ncbi:hypothetical protein SAMN05216403_1365 [Nitrosospira multiformis ATCC 25196]|uniref:Uncharacterized protein n=1 Tax=Nitrosospira multiformis (strain ATCC 25196 / NCIMB 11849 / C 71) TaxID=323848 RepID=A0A1H5XSI4_NITMU|nr:hypothetical protein SAMN05216403_1365 [Nitrosospira multiformis ATCC 25196]
MSGKEAVRKLNNAIPGYFADHPVRIDWTHDFDEFLVVNGLGHLSRHTEIEAVQPVVLLIRGGQHHYGNTSELLIIFYRLQEFNSIHDGHVQVEQDEAGFVAVLIPEVVFSASSPFSRFQMNDLVYHVNLLERPHNRHLVHRLVLTRRIGLFVTLILFSPLSYVICQLSLLSSPCMTLEIRLIFLSNSYCLVCHTHN